MRAAILVLESPCYAIVSRDGSFSIEGVPAGRYDLVTWNIDAGSKKTVVDVAAGRTLELQIRLDGRSDTAAVEQKMLLHALAAATAGSAEDLPKETCCPGKR